MSVAVTHHGAADIPAGRGVICTRKRWMQPGRVRNRRTPSPRPRPSHGRHPAPPASMRVGPGGTIPHSGTDHLPSGEALEGPVGEDDRALAIHLVDVGRSPGREASQPGLAVCSASSARLRPVMSARVTTLPKELVAALQGAEADENFADLAIRAQQRTVYRVQAHALGKVGGHLGEPAAYDGRPAGGRESQTEAWWNGSPVGWRRRADTPRGWRG